MPTPFVHTGLTLACFAVTQRERVRRERKSFLRLSLVVMCLANAPDLDLLPALFDVRLWETYHRWLGHNLLALAVWSWLGQLGIRRWAAPQLPPRSAWVTAICAVVGHVLLDALCVSSDQTRASVPLLWPFSSQLLGIAAIFPGVALPEHTNPILGLVTSGDYWRRVVFFELGYSLILFGAWCLGAMGIRATRARLLRAGRPTTGSAQSHPTRLSAEQRGSPGTSTLSEQSLPRCNQSPP